MAAVNSTFSGMAARARGSEEAFYKKLQELDVADYFEREVDATRRRAAANTNLGRLEELRREFAARARALEPPTPRTLRAAGKPLPDASGMLNSIAAHGVRLQQQRSAVETRRLQKFFGFQEGFRTGSDPKCFTRYNALVDGLTLGARVSLGRAKWNAGHETVEGVSFFDFRKGMELAEGGHAEVQAVAAQGMRPPAPAVKGALDPPELMELGRGLKLRVMPEYTPARAIFWGSVLAVWCTAAASLTFARTYGIKTPEDMREVLPAMLGPTFKPLQEKAAPLKEQLSMASLKESEFIHHLQRDFRGGRAL